MSVGELNPRTTLLQRILICCALLVLLSACGGGTNAQSTPTATTLQLVTFDLGIPKAALNSPVVGSVPDTTKFHVIVTFKPDDDVLNRLGTSKVSSTQTTDGADLANQLGITNEQYAQIKQFFGIQGVSLNLSKLHTSLALDAPASSFAQLLKTKFVYHEYQGRKFFAPASDVRLPLAIATHIQAITGLDNYSLPPQKKSLKTSLALPLSTRTNEAANCAADPRTLFPQDIAGAYGLKPLYNQGWLGQGTTIILPEFEAFSQSDLQNYLACVQFKGKINVVTVNGHVPTTEGGEALLDLEMVAGLLPAANIVVYQEDPGAQYEYFWESFYDILNQIASDYSKVSGPTEISMSWGQAETHMTIGEVNAIDTQLRIISQVDHINTFVASGDCGAYDSTHYPSFLDTDFPSSDRAVIGVGGTELAVDQQLNRAQEIVWSGDPQKYPDCKNTWGSGGGLSQAFDLPTWQAGPGVQNKYSNGKRQIPDVAAVAWNIAIYSHSQWSWSGGTSAAAPIWASVYALVNQGLVAKTGYFIGGGPGVFYLLAQKEALQHPFYDVVQGNNLYYPATPSWDFSTGFGTPNAVGLYNGLMDLLKSA